MAVEEQSTQGVAIFEGQAKTVKMDGQAKAALDSLGESEEGEKDISPAVGSASMQFSAEELFEKVASDEAVRLRIIGEYLASLGKSEAPLTAGGKGVLAAPLVKAKSVGEAGDMALLYFRKNN